MFSKRYDVYEWTGTAALDKTLPLAKAAHPSISPSPRVKSGGEWRFAGFTLHTDGAIGAESITFVTNDGEGAAYDTVLLSVDLTGLTDKKYMIPADERVPLKDGDELDIDWANGGGDTYGIRVFIERE